jgi:hypothetical protein
MPFLPYSGTWRFFGFRVFGFFLYFGNLIIVRKTSNMSSAYATKVANPETTAPQKSRVSNPGKM